MSQTETGEKSRSKRGKKPPIVIKTHRRTAPTKLRDIKVDFREQTKLVRYRLTGKRSGKEDLVTLVRQGLPLSSVEKIQKTLKFRDVKPVLELMGISVRTYQRRQKEQKHLDSIESDRLYRIAKVETRAAEVFDDEDVAIDWLKSPNRALGATPISLLDTEAGQEMVERVLTRIEHGVYS
ncbi:type II RES/Xre toxin-antitoxin system antitoxin [Thiohalomonas denitrificans]|uniref:Putative toxin-antitoxin system antitoxin component, TIGR02293 family n=1 Tax=Thiohalomonas denitrificans TaxID=415747 RepID=A0A1G5QXS4_9GAMM|nr:antitoxin Xre/MbcA/ParS toxin-binding domain-containing protein [Thiohalomonas denitrificans]SCZ66496.1 putative toxin-antitoxin system antitoxin component, TIGR02293 family [Thiohalomonas denitrificans]